MAKVEDYGSRDNRGRTSPSPAPLGSPRKGATQSGCRRQAVGTVRRYGHIGKIVLDELVRLARSSDDPGLASELEARLGPFFDCMVSFEIELTEIREFPDEES